jgi:hypothetical protein
MVKFIVLSIFILFLIDLIIKSESSLKITQIKNEKTCDFFNKYLIL